MEAYQESNLKQIREEDGVDEVTNKRKGKEGDVKGLLEERRRIQTSIGGEQKNLNYLKTDETQKKAALSETKRETEVLFKLIQHEDVLPLATSAGVAGFVDRMQERAKLGHDENTWEKM